MVEREDALEIACTIAEQCRTDLTVDVHGLSREVIRANAQVAIVYALIAVTERLDRLTEELERVLPR